MNSMQDPNSTPLPDDEHMPGAEEVSEGWTQEAIDRVVHDFNSRLVDMNTSDLATLIILLCHDQYYNGAVGKIGKINTDMLSYAVQLAHFIITGKNAKDVLGI